MSDEEALAALIRSGALIPVAVFGNCEHPVPTSSDYAAATGKRETTCEDESHWSWGLMDRSSEHSPAGSDCNRAIPYMLRPSDKAMHGPMVRKAIWEMLDEYERRDPEVQPLTGEPSDHEKALAEMKAQFDQVLADSGFPDLEWTWGRGAVDRPPEVGA